MRRNNIIIIGINETDNEIVSCCEHYGSRHQDSNVLTAYISEQDVENNSFDNLMALIDETNFSSDPAGLYIQTHGNSTKITGTVEGIANMIINIKDRVPRLDKVNLGACQGAGRDVDRGSIVMEPRLLKTNANKICELLVGNIGVGSIKLCAYRANITIATHGSFSNNKLYYNDTYGDEEYRPHGNARINDNAERTGYSGDMEYLRPKPFHIEENESVAEALLLEKYYENHKDFGRNLRLSPPRGKNLTGKMVRKWILSDANNPFIAKVRAEYMKSAHSCEKIRLCDPGVVGYIQRKICWKVTNQGARLISIQDYSDNEEIRDLVRITEMSLCPWGPQYVRYTLGL